jgi:hypothetical protein
MKYILGVVVFLGLCVGAYYIVEDRHDAQLRTDNKLLITQVKDKEKELARVQEENAKERGELFKMLVKLYPKEKENMEKVFSKPAEKEE